MGKKRIGVVLSGCGVADGAEIHEATLTLYFLDKANAQVVIMAPNIPQYRVINHLTNQPSDEQRNVLVEAARIARGKIRDLATVKADEIDALILPGGFGAALNLSTLGIDGANARVSEDLRTLLLELHKVGKPIGAICISPAVIAKVFADKGITVTIGSDQGTAQTITALGNIHKESRAEQIVVDNHHKIVTTPAYMCAASIGEAGAGIERLVDKILELA